MKIRVIVLMVFSIVLGSTAVYSDQPNNLAPDQRFGMIEAFWAPEEAAELNVGWERILFYWREIQPQGPEDWNTLHVLEEWLTQAKADGRIIVGLLKNTAPWASEDGTEAGLPKGLYLPVDHPENLWAGFVRKVAAYYSVRDVHHWIIWNEPEIRPGIYGYEFAGSAADYYQLVKVAYRVMKQVDPEAVIHLAGLTWWHDPDYLNKFLGVVSNDPEATSNNHFFDVISLHIYFRTETIKSILESVQGIQEKYDIEKKVWINETNAPPNLDPLWPVERPQFDVDIEQQSWFVIQALSLGFASGAERIGVYKLLDIHLPIGGESYGLLRPDFSHRPAYEAYRLATLYLSGFTEVRLEQGFEHFIATFVRPGGVTRVLWARSPANQILQIPALTINAKLIDTDGAVADIAAVDGSYAFQINGARCHGECIIGGPPLFLVEDGARLDVEPLQRAVRLESLPPTATPTNTPLPTTTPTETPTPTPSPTVTPTLEPTLTPSVMATRVATTGGQTIAQTVPTTVLIPTIASQNDGDNVADEATPVIELLGGLGALAIIVGLTTLFIRHRHG